VHARINLSYLAWRIGHLVPIWQPSIGSSFHPFKHSCMRVRTGLKEGPLWGGGMMCASDCLSIGPQQDTGAASGELPAAAEICVDSERELKEEMARLGRCGEAAASRAGIGV
jgi:hypothetical protein